MITLQRFQNLLVGKNEHLGTPNLLGSFRHFLKNGGPDPEWYDSISDFSELVLENLNSHSVSAEEIQTFLQSCAFIHEPDSIIGKMHLSSNGTMQNHPFMGSILGESISEKYDKWDAYTLQLPVIQAWLKRKGLFHQALLNLGSGGGLVLNLGCESSIEMAEFYKSYPDSNVLCTYIDHCPQSIEQTKRNCNPFRNKVNPIQANPLEYKCIQTYHLVWSSFVLDRLKEEDLIALLRKSMRWLKPGGMAVFCFTPRPCPDGRDFLELFGNLSIRMWAPEELIRLSQEAGYKRNKLKIEKSDCGTNLILKLRNAF
ncbi:MAG: class I SAM-dependent methyltransferase [Cryomorphaceae bacterium]|nr:MAG: class I SAM-dependent methyltransferase [Cryomorphaceae bacterium]